MNAVNAPLHHDASDDYTAQPTREINSADVAQLPGLLDSLSPDCSRDEWIRAMMAAHYTTGGSDAGLAIFDAWSSKGKKYKGLKEVQYQWHSLDGHNGPYIKIGTLIDMTRNAGANISGITHAPKVLQSFEPATIVHVTGSSDKVPFDVLSTHPLGKYSLLGRSAEVKKQVCDEAYVFDDIALQGQATGVYGEPGTGKTVLAMHFAIDGIKHGRIDPAKFFYINCDDTASGLACKLELADKYGFHMLSAGYRGFNANLLLDILMNLIQTGDAKGVIVVLDTMKKFTNLMDKTISSRFTSIVRAFVLKGGTVIALAHTNKKRGNNGKPILGGTSDVKDDFDCIYIVDMAAQQLGVNQRVVTFTKEKSRGDNIPSVSYSYSVERGLPYSDILESVQEVDAGQLQPNQVDSDAPIVAAIAACISEGIVTKMDLAEAASKRAEVSNRAALRTIEKYTGNDAGVHRWSFVLQGHGAKVFQLLQGTLPVALSATMPGSDTLQAGAVLVSDAPATELDLDAQHHTEILEKFDRLLGITQVSASENDEY